jgi:hypothetical protein
MVRVPREKELCVCEGGEAVSVVREKEWQYVREGRCMGV